MIYLINVLYFIYYLQNYVIDLLINVVILIFIYDIYLLSIYISISISISSSIIPFLTTSTPIITYISF
jgi:hypothetical protein